jgi:hypothetical protein
MKDWIPPAADTLVSGGGRVLDRDKNQTGILRNSAVTFAIAAMGSGAAVIGRPMTK